MLFIQLRSSPKFGTLLEALLNTRGLTNCLNPGQWPTLRMPTSPWSARRPDRKSSQEGELHFFKVFCLKALFIREMKRKEIKAQTMRWNPASKIATKWCPSREGPRPAQAVMLGTLWVAAALLAMERVVSLESRVGAVDPVVRVRS